MRVFGKFAILVILIFLGWFVFFNNNQSKLTQWTETETIEQLHKRMLAKELTPVELTEFYLAQIARHNDTLNAVINVNPQAKSQAAELTKELEEGNVRSPLHGMPILLKDNIDTKNMPTTAGSRALFDNMTGRDASFVAELKKAGVIILGKTNLSEWANFRSEHSSSGWSAIGGQTRNPVDVNRTTCGSSSGSAAAVAANLAIAAIGTETNGSITCPAAMTGVVGIKPTVGMVSRFGIVPISPTQDTAGPMAKSLEDAALILKYMSAVDINDDKTNNELVKTAQSLTVNTLSINVEPDSINTLKLGVFVSSAHDLPAIKQIYNDLNQTLTLKGIELVEIKQEPYPEFWQDSYDVLLDQFEPALADYFASLDNKFNTMRLADLITYNQEHKQTEMPYFDQGIFIKSVARDAINSDAHQTRLNKITAATQKDGLDKYIKEHDLDAVIAITRGPAWMTDLVNGDQGTGGVSTYAAVAGYPHVTFPFAKVQHLPIGLSVMGLYNQDKKIIEIAMQLNQVLVKQN